MIYMSMGQKDCVQRMGWDGERIPVPAPEFPFLVQPTVNQKPDVTGFQHIPGARDITGCT